MLLLKNPRPPFLSTHDSIGRGRLSGLPPIIESIVNLMISGIKAEKTVISSTDTRDRAYVFPLPRKKLKSSLNFFMLFLLTSSKTSEYLSRDVKQAMLLFPEGTLKEPLRHFVPDPAMRKNL